MPSITGGGGWEAGRGVLPAPVFLVLSLPSLVTIYLGAPSSLFGVGGGKEKKILFSDLGGGGMESAGDAEAVSILAP